MSLKGARAHLELAKEQADRATTDSWEPSDTASCVTNAFYAYENLIVATAEAHGISWQKNHYRKADLAKQLAEDRILGTDLSAELLRLNDLRKDVSYGAPGHKLQNEDLDDLVSTLQQVVEEVEVLIGKLEDE